MITDQLCKILYVWVLIFFTFVHTKEPHFQLEPLNNGSRGLQIVQAYQNQQNSNFYTKFSPSFYPQNQTFFNHKQLKSAAMLAFLQAHMSESDFQKLKHNLQIQSYGVNTDYLKNVLYKKSIEELENWLIENKQLTKEQALNIWTSFCEHKNFRWKKKSTGYAHIEQEYNQRKKNTVTQQQELQAKQKSQQIEPHNPVLGKDAIILSRDLESLQEQYVLPPTYLCQGIDSKTLQERQKALQKTIEQNYTQYEQSYFLNPQTTAYLQMHDLKPTDYTSCFGTPLQQQLHTEVCQLFDQIAQQENKIMFATDAINFTDAAHDQNQKEQITTATTLADIAWVLAAIPLGIFESAKDAILLPFHAPQIIKSLGQALYFVIETSVINNLAKYTNLPKAIQERDERNALIKQGIVQAASAIYNATWHDKIKGSTRLIADFYVPGKIFYATGHLFAGVAAQSKKLRSLENVTAMIDHDSGFAEMVEEILETTKTLEPATPEGLKGQMLFECMEAEAVATQAANIISRPLKVIIDEIKALGGAIPLHRTDLYHEFTTAMQEIMTKINKPLSKNFMTKYQNRKINNLSINLNLKHIAQSSFKMEKRARKGVYEIMMELNHEPGVCHAFEQAGLVKITNIKKLPNGCCEYSLENIFNGKPFTKTEFPSHWDIEKIIQSAWEIYTEPSILQEVAEDGKHLKKGIIDGDIKIKIIIKNHADGSNIITAYPC